MTVYYEEMAAGLAILEKIERDFDEVDFFTKGDHG
jgi:hypothetical protein